MPSRKKERGRARRAAKKASPASRSGNDQNAASTSKSDCDHLGIGTNWQQNDYDLATELADSFESIYRTLVNSGVKDGHHKFEKMVNDMYDAFSNQ